MSQSNLHQWARYYAQRGWKVFPLKEHTPLPATAHGFKDASCDLTQVDAWWSQWPNANIGVNLAASGLMAFDVDPQNGGDVTAARDFPGVLSSVVADTPSGGTHSIFTVPSGVEIPAQYGEGVDGKWRGYVVLHPSYRKNFKNKPDGPYVWRAGFEGSPPEVPEMLRAKPRVARERTEPRLGSLEEVPQIREWLEALDSSFYEEGNWINVAMALHHWENHTEGAEGAGLALFDAWSSEDPQSHRYDSDAIEALWERLHADRDSGITLGSLKHWAGKTAKQQQESSMVMVRAAFTSSPVADHSVLWTEKPVPGFHVPFDVAKILGGMKGRLADAWSSDDLETICWELAYETGSCCAHMWQVLSSKGNPEALWHNAREAVMLAAEGRKDHRGASGYTDDRAEKAPTLEDWPVESDQHQAEILALKQAGRVRYSPGLGWFCWDREKGKWVADDGVAARRLLAAQFVACFSGDTPSSTKVLMGSARKLSSALTCAQDHRALFVASDAWDADSYVLNTPAAAYDLRTGQPIERSGLFVSKVTQVSPDFSMPTPMWDAAIRNACPDWEFLEQSLAYGLTAERTEELMFIAYGDGLNGKSKILGAVKGMLGDYSVMLNGSVLLRGNQHEDVKELAMLRGKRFVFVDELKQGGTWDDARVKKLATDATISVKLMHKDGFEAPALHKLYIASNHLPNVDASDFGMERRLALVKFPHKMKPEEVDRDFGAKLQAEWPGILAKLIGLCAGWWASKLSVPESVQANVKEYLGQNDDIAEWLEECCLTDDPKAFTRTTDLYLSFISQLEPSKRAFNPRKAFKEALSKKGFPHVKLDSVRGTRGIRFRMGSE